MSSSNAYRQSLIGLRVLMAIVIAGCDIILGADAREAVAARREQLDEVLRRYGASNPRLFGSVARGDATTDSDLDVLVDLDPAGGNPLMRLAGLSEEFRRVLGVDVDVVAAELLRDGVAETALTDAAGL